MESFLELFPAVQWNFVYALSSILVLSLQMVCLPHILLNYRHKFLSLFLNQQTGVSVMHVFTVQLCGQHEENKIGKQKGH